MSKDVNDPAVSALYRQAAVETAPDALNQAVLRAAHSEATSGTGAYTRAATWLRPLAWAATIGLCLAIVLELNSVPRVELEMLADPAEHSSDASSASAPARRREQPISRDSSEPELDSRANYVGPAAAPVELRKADVAEAEEAAPGDSIAEELATQPVLGTTERAMADQVVDQAAEIASLHEAKNELPDLALPAAASAARLEAALAMPCSGEIRETPERWHACIEDLEAQGLQDLAATQREAFSTAFPDFEVD